MIACLLIQNFDTVPKFRSMFNTLQSTNQLPCSVLNFEEHPSTPTHLHSYCAFRIVELSLHLVWLYVLGGNLVASAQKWNLKVSIHFWHCYHKATVTHFKTEKNLITHKLTKFLPLKFYKRNAMPSSDNFVIFFSMIVVNCFFQTYAVAKLQINKVAKIQSKKGAKLNSYKVE